MAYNMFKHINYYSKVKAGGGVKHLANILIILFIRYE